MLTRKATWDSKNESNTKSFFCQKSFYICDKIEILLGVILSNCGNIILKNFAKEKKLEKDTNLPEARVVLNQFKEDKPGG